MLFMYQPESQASADYLKSKLGDKVQLERFDGDGHALFVDDPEKFNHVLEEFVQASQMIHADVHSPLYVSVSCPLRRSSRYLAITDTSSFPFVPCSIGSLKSVIVWLSVFSDTLRNNFLTREKFPLLQTDQIVTSRSGSPSVPFDKGVNPVQSPESISCQPSGVVYDGPIFVNERKEAIHQVRDIVEVWWGVFAYVNRFFSVSSPKLSYIRNSGIVECPQSVFIKRFDLLF